MKVTNPCESKMARKERPCDVCCDIIRENSFYESYKGKIFCGPVCKMDYFAKRFKLNGQPVCFLGIYQNDKFETALFVAERSGNFYLTFGRQVLGGGSLGYFWVENKSYPVSILSGEGVLLKEGENRISFNSNPFIVRI